MPRHAHSRASIIHIYIYTYFKQYRQDVVISSMDCLSIVCYMNQKGLSVPRFIKLIFVLMQNNLKQCMNAQSHDIYISVCICIR